MLLGGVAVLLVLGMLGEVTRNLGGVVLGIVVALGLLSVLWLVARSRLPRRRMGARSTTLADLLRLTPAEFEVWTGEWLRAAGYRQVRRVGGPGDLAADLVCLTPDGARVVVQCKRYAPHRRVGSPEIQTFLGMATIHHSADLGIFVTTAGFTAPARALADQHGLLLLDGDALLASSRTRPLPRRRTSASALRRRSGAA